MNSEIQQHQYPKLWQIFIIILLTLFVVFIFGTIAFFIGGRTGVLLAEASIILPALVFVIKYNYSPVLLFRLRPIKINLVAVSIILGIALTVISDEIDRLIQIFIPMPEGFRQIYEKFLLINSLSDFVIVIFSAVILAAVLEEMLFRGFVQTGLENNFNAKVAIVVTAFIFAIFHLYPWVLIQIFFIGIIMGFLAQRSNSIIPSLIVHLINNGIAITCLNVSAETYQWYLYKGHVNLLILIAAILLTSFGMKLFFHLCKSTSAE